MRGRRTRLAFVAGLLAAVALVPLLALAATSPATVQSGTVFNATDGPQVELGEDATIDTSQPFPTNESVELGITNTTGDELNVTAFGVEPGSQVSSLVFGDLPGPSAVQLARNDTGLAVAATGGNVSQVDLLDSATVDDGVTDVGVVTGSASGTVEIRNLSTDGIDLVRPDGTVAARSSVSSGTASVTLPANTTNTYAVETTRPRFDNSSGAPTAVTRAPGETVSLGIDVNHGQFPGESVTVEFRRWETGDPSQDTLIGDTTRTSAGTATTNWQLPDLNAPSAQWYAVATDEAGVQAVSQTFYIELDDDAAGDPVLDESTATDDELITGGTTDLSIDVGHEDGSESVDVEFYEFDTGDPSQDTLLDNTTVTTTGTATVSNVGVNGVLDYYVVATDGSGQTDSSSVFRVAQPGALTVRDDTDGTVVDNRTVQFDITGPGFSELINVTDGQLGYNNTSASAGDTVLITVRAADYYETTLQVPELGTDDTIYLQRGPNYEDPPTPDDPTDSPDPGDDNSTVLVRFELVDQTQGKYPSEESSLTVERANGNAVKSAPFGSVNRVDTILQQGDRYQLTVDGPGGTRSLGGFTASQSETVPLTIEGRDFGVPAVDGYEIDAKLVKQQAANFIVVEFEDPAKNTSELNIEIRERTDESNVIYQETVTSQLGNYSAQVAITDNQTAEVWEVRYNGTRDGERIEGVVPVGGDNLVPLPGGNILTGMVVLGLTLIAALYSGPLAALGSIILVAVAGGAILLGWLPISPLIWFAAAVVAAGGFAREANGP